MILLENRTSIKCDIELLDKIMDYLNAQMVELILTDNREIQEINKEHRNIDKATDVLSFPLQPMPHSPLGSIMISLDKVDEKSKELLHSFDAELALLFTHGLLHLLGYDHEEDNGEMRAKEREVIEFFSLPSSLIQRVE
jgi:probable rRNA maturation factor